MVLPMTDRWRSILFKLTEPFAGANRQQKALPLAQLIGGGCFAIALLGCAPAPPIKAIEPTAILGFGVSMLPPKPASLAAHPPPLG